MFLTPQAVDDVQELAVVEKVRMLDGACTTTCRPCWPCGSFLGWLRHRRLGHIERGEAHNVREPARDPLMLTSRAYYTLAATPGWIRPLA